jgi:hypothetical protein
MGGDVVAGEGAGELLVADRLVVAGDGEVPCPPVAAGERAVGNLADERLDELVLADLGDFGSRSTSRSSRRTRSRRRGSSVPASMPVVAVSASVPKTCPRTAASWRRPRSVGSRASSREAMSDRSDSGTRSSERSPAGT